MKLKTAAQIDRTIDIALSIVILPFTLTEFVIGHLASAIIKILEWCEWPFIQLSRTVGNKLLLSSDEVKDGTICNKEALRYSANSVYQLWKQEKENEIKEDKDDV